MTEPNQVRPIMNLANLVTELMKQVRNYIETAYYAGKADGTVKGRKQVVGWLKARPSLMIGLEVPAFLKEWQAKLKEWEIE